MTPNTGAISLGDLRTELGLSGQVSLGDSTIRDYTFVSSGAISLNDGRAVHKDTITASTSNVNMKSRAIAAGWNETVPLKYTLTINSGLIISSSSTGSYSLETGSTFPAGTKMKLNNNGTIVGRGGNGGNGGTSAAGSSGGAGGPGLRAQVSLIVNNAGRIAGGGGGGGGGGAYSLRWFGYYYGYVGSGSGGGGGDGGIGGSAGGSRGNSYYFMGGYGGYGAIGNGGSTASYSTGGVTQAYSFYDGSSTVSVYTGRGSGGNYGASGGTAATGYKSGGYGYIVANTAYASGSAGGGGACTNGAATYITWAATGTRNGTIG